MQKEKKSKIPVVGHCVMLLLRFNYRHIELPINQLTLIVEHHFDLNLTNYIVNILWQICFDAIKMFTYP